MRHSLQKGEIPLKWKKISYPSLKPLGSYIMDIESKLKFFKKWLEEKMPEAFCIGAFYSPQSFLTAILQNYSRKHSVPIDNLTFDFKFLDENPTENEVLQDFYDPPEDGNFAYGFYFEAARWNFKMKKIIENKPKIVHSYGPIIWFKPILLEDSYNLEKNQDKNLYICPVYRTLERKGTLSTTGHSTNFLIYIKFPCDKNQKFWVKRGVALFCQLSE